MGVLTVFRLIEFLRAVCTIVDFDQCSFGLQLPGAQPHQFCQKSTRLIGSIPTLKKLEQKCPGKSSSHVHDHAFGSASIVGPDGQRKTLSKAGAAGIYPVGLCKPWAASAAEHLKAVFWRGKSPWGGH